MSPTESFSARRAPVGVALRAAVLDAATAIGPEEAEFLEALRRVLARSPAQDLWEKYHGAGQNGAARILARYAD